MSGLHNLNPDRVVKAFERAGWSSEGRRGSHVKLTKVEVCLMPVGELAGGKLSSL